MSSPILSPTPPNPPPQGYILTSALTYYWDIPTLDWVRGTQVSSSVTAAVTVADGADVTQGAIADAAVITDTTGTISGKLRGLVKWAFERMPAALGQGTMAQSLRVVVASDQSAVPVSAATLPLPTGAATAALQTQPGVDIGDVTVNNGAGAAAVNIQDGGNAITIDAASLPLPTGAATAALQTQPGTDIGDVTINNAAGAAAVNVQDGGNSLTVDGAVTNSGSAKTLQSASFSLAATGTVVAAVPTKRIKVYAVKVVVSAAISINFRDGGATALEGAQAYAANGGATEAVTPPEFLFATTAGNSLDLVISGAGTAAGRVSYWDNDAT